MRKTPVVTQPSAVIGQAVELVKNHPNDIVAVYSMKQTCVWASPSHHDILGYTPEEMVGHHWKNMVAPEYHHQAGLAGIDSFLNGKSIEFGFQGVTKSGGRVKMRGSGTIRLDPVKKYPYLIFQAYLDH